MATEEIFFGRPGGVSDGDFAESIAYELTLLAIVDVIPPHMARQVALKLRSCVEGIEDLGGVPPNVQALVKKRLEGRIEHIERRLKK